MKTTFYNFLKKIDLFENSIRDITQDAIVFDLDGTLFKTDSQIRILNKNTNEILKRMTHDQFELNLLKPNEIVSYYEFTRIDLDNAGPLPILNDFKNSLQNPNEEVYILTARNSLVVPDVIELLRRHRINMFDIDNLYTVGDTPDEILDGPHKKRLVLTKIRKRHPGKVRFLDDDQRNIDFENTINIDGKTIESILVK